MRGLSADFITEINAGVYRPALFFEGVFTNGTLNLWTGYGDISWNSKTWLGNGWLHVGGAVSKESDDLAANGLSIELAGVPLSVISLVLSESKQGAPGKLWLGFLNSSNGVVSSPYLMFDGKYDLAEIDERQEDPVITIAYESRLIDLERSREFRYNTETQHTVWGYTEDRGFEYLPSVRDWSGAWGKQAKPSAPPPKPGGSSRGKKTPPSRGQRRGSNTARGSRRR